MTEINVSELTEAGVLSLSEAYAEPDWLRDRRLEAYKAFSDLDWPHKRIEEWRRTDPAKFELTRPVAHDAGQASPVEGGIVAGGGELAATARIVDGAVVDAQVSDEAAAQGVVVTDLATAARDHRAVVEPALGSAIGPHGKFEALSLAAFTGSVVVIVPGEVKVEKPIGITVQTTKPSTVLPRLLVIGGAYSESIVYLDHDGSASTMVVESVETVLAEGAKANVVTAQEWGEGVQAIAYHTGKPERQATYRHLEITFGGDYQYIRPDVWLAGEAAHGELLGVYFTDEGQHVEQRSVIHHDAPHTTSETVYKGALQGNSRAVWFGNIRIEPHAKSVAADETNRNMLLSDGARADSIPFLEIMTSDVASCGHRSSIGQVDEAQLFYLESRGIPRPEAARLLVFGFFAEVTDRIDLPGVTETVMAELEREVQSSPVTLDPRRQQTQG